MSEAEGGAELLTGGCLHFSFRAGPLRGSVTLPQGMEVLHPLHTATVTVALEQPVALESGQRFVFRHRGRAAGSGVVTGLPR
ncbi:hypothetical protein [Streptomyces sp. NPDC049555]|uniref:EF-Tu C-terminal domain-related protein n=1 Tax=Streptomyces sp. NPDC049555 TaxID=3154930 RepID=UPI00342C620B